MKFGRESEQGNLLMMVMARLCEVRASWRDRGWDWRWHLGDGEHLDEGFAPAAEENRSKRASVLINAPGSRSHGEELFGHVVRYTDMIWCGGGEFDFCGQTNIWSCRLGNRGRGRRKAGAFPYNDIAKAPISKVFFFPGFFSIFFLSFLILFSFCM